MTMRVVPEGLTAAQRRRRGADRTDGGRPCRRCAARYRGDPARR